MKIYRPIDLYFHPIDAARYSVTLTAPGGRSATSDLQLPADDEYRQLLARLADDSAGRDDLARLGTRLYKALFAGQIGEALLVCRAQLPAAERLCLRLHMDVERAPTLAAVPWEFLFAPDDPLPLVLKDIPIVRCVRQPAEPGLPPARPLRVLLSAATNVQPATRAERELAAIAEALRDLDGQVGLTIDPHLTKERLLDHLRHDVHIWHFVGHGGVAADGGQLLFEDATSPGQAEPIPAHWLMTALAAARPALVVLEACESGRIVAEHPIWSMAPALAYEAVPAVVAMQLPVAAEAAQAFAAEFYKELASGQVVEACVNAGRRALVLQTRSLQPDWGIPVVYTRGEQATPAAGVGRPADPVARGFRALVELLGDARVRAIATAVFSSRSTVQLVRRQIGELAEYKKLHDLLHEMQDSFNTIAADRDRLGTDPHAWAELARNEPDLYSRIGAITDAVARGIAARGRAPRLARLGEARSLLRAAIRERNQPRFEQATEIIRALLESEPYRINISLVQQARGLVLGQLTDALAAIGQHRSELSLDAAGGRLLDEFQHGLAELTQIDARLAELVHDHDMFQELDLELRRAEAEARRDLAALAASWNERLRAMSCEVCAGRAAPWAPELRGCTDDLDQALAGGDSYLITIMFERQRSQIDQIFNRTDKDINDICQRLTDIGREIDRLLEQITQ